MMELNMFVYTVVSRSCADLHVKVARTRPLVHQSQCVHRVDFARLQCARYGPAATARVRLGIKVRGASFEF